MLVTRMPRSCQRTRTLSAATRSRRCGDCSLAFLADSQRPKSADDALPPVRMQVGAGDAHVAVGDGSVDEQPLSELEED